MKTLVLILGLTLLPMKAKAQYSYRCFRVEEVRRASRDSALVNKSFKLPWRAANKLKPKRYYLIKYVNRRYSSYVEKRSCN